MLLSPPHWMSLRSKGLMEHIYAIPRYPRGAIFEKHLLVVFSLSTLRGRYQVASHWLLLTFIHGAMFMEVSDSNK
ncbi:uncharacterized protein BJX67DRAFT_346965 [Aspergillus lucknowensis]|uniref:Uncharacterized protein n=1 Tax=Aspergillus lucknowensis TaxID=176173 RepID=A0ABR4LYZ9_9EURO